MPNYAIIENKKVINVIVAEDKESAEEVSGLSAIETDGEPWIDWTLEADGWRSPSPYPSWIWHNNQWNAPIEKPNTPGVIFYWDEQSLSWQGVENKSPFPSWILSEDGTWQSPVPYPEDGKIYIWNEENQEWILMEVNNNANSV